MSGDSSVPRDYFCHGPHTAKLKEILVGFPASLRMEGKVMFSMPRYPGRPGMPEITLRCGLFDLNRVFVESEEAIRAMKRDEHWFWQWLVREFWNEIGQRFIGRA